MKTITKILIAIVIVLLLGVAVSIYGLQKTEPPFTLGGQADATRDFIGTRTGTTTAAVAFATDATSAGQSATSTYPIFIGKEVDLATISLFTHNASSTANVQLSFIGSNDDQCDTASTTTVYDIVTTGQVRWYDIGDHLRNKVHSTSLAIGTSTLVWTNPAVGTAREIILEDLDAQCIAMQISASSTELWSQINLKSYN